MVGAPILAVSGTTRRKVCGVVITSSWIGVLSTDGHAVVKDGGLAGSWMDETNGAKRLRLSGNWIGVVFNDGTAWVKEGDLYAAWTPGTVRTRSRISSSAVPPAAALDE
ncbi:hypothetical protein ACFVSN_01260 [Kitasatospora sp. NPDC057904]|uniref:hypothetical protein n=1 Tax=unclassified Kitasatospora TaxID=2633591 RepID=UPI0036DD0F5C